MSRRVPLVSDSLRHSASTFCVVLFVALLASSCGAGAGPNTSQQVRATPTNNPTRDSTTFAGTTLPPLTTTTVPPPQVEIRTPATGSRVPIEVTATGVAKNIPEGARLWLVVKVGNGYYPQIGALTLLPSGEWSQQVLFGGPNDGGKTFMLMAVQADSAAHQRFDRWIRDGRATGIFPAMEEGGEYPTVTPLAAVTLIRS